MKNSQAFQYDCRSHMETTKCPLWSPVESIRTSHSRYLSSIREKATCVCVIGTFVSGYGFSSSKAPVTELYM